MANKSGRMGIGIISAGKVGAVLGSALRAAGHQIIGAYATSEESVDRLENLLPAVPALDVPTIVERSEMVLLALPTAEIEPLVAGLANLKAWQSGQIVIHTAGRLGTNVLMPAADAGALCLALHPAMRFSGTSLDVARLAECTFAVTASPMLQPIGHALAAEMGARSVVVSEEDRPAYHAAFMNTGESVSSAVTQAILALNNLGIEQPGDLLRLYVKERLEEALSREFRAFSAHE